MQEAQDRIRELLKPRIKVIAPYPFMSVGVGEQLRSNKNTYHMTTTNYRNEFGENVNQENYVPLSDIETYPHLFKKLRWYEERAIEDLPKFVMNKTATPKKIMPVTWVIEQDDHLGNHEQLFAVNHGRYYPWGLLPATEKEYTDFINQQKR